MSLVWREKTSVKFSWNRLHIKFKVNKQCWEFVTFGEIIVDGPGPGLGKTLQHGELVSISITDTDGFLQSLDSLFYVLLEKFNHCHDASIYKAFTSNYEDIDLLVSRLLIQRRWHKNTKAVALSSHSRLNDPHLDQ